MKKKKKTTKVQAKKAKPQTKKAKAAKKPTKAAKKTAKPAVKKAAPVAKVIPAKIEKKEPKKAAAAFMNEGFSEDMGEEETTPATPDTFTNDDFDTSRKELETGYVSDDEDEEGSEDDDLYGDDETESFESYDDEFSDFDDEEDEYAGGFGKDSGKKKKSFDEDYEEE